MGRIQGLDDTARVLTESQLLKTGPGYVFSITIGFQGTAGHKEILRDETDGTGDPFAVFVFSIGKE